MLSSPLTPQQTPHPTATSLSKRFASFAYDGILLGNSIGALSDWCHHASLRPTLCFYFWSCLNAYPNIVLLVNTVHIFVCQLPDWAIHSLYILSIPPFYQGCVPLLRNRHYRSSTIHSIDTYHFTTTSADTTSLDFERETRDIALQSTDQSRALP
jgi:hypothetical protein